jgi:hypothetical protein
MSKFIPAHTKHSTPTFLLLAALSVVLLMVLGGTVPTATNFNHGVGLHPSTEVGNASAVNSSANSSNAVPALETSQISVTILTPVNQTGQSLAEVSLNGTAYSNGTVLSPLTVGYNYVFSAVNIAPTYSFDQWYATYGTVPGNLSPTTPVQFTCHVIYLYCASGTLTLDLLSSNHGLMSGYVGQAKVVSEVNATFTIPTNVGPWTIPGHPALPGLREVTNWGVGIGGITSGSKALFVGVQITGIEGATGLFNRTYQPFWSTSISGITTSVQTNFTQKLYPGNTVSVRIAPNGTCPNEVYISNLTLHNSSTWTRNACYTQAVGATSGQWGAWDPLATSNVLGLNYSYSGGKGRFSNLTFNGNTVPVWTGQPFTVSPTPPLIGVSQWMNAGGGWSESLYSNPLSSFQPTAAAIFSPGVESLASVQFTIFPYNVSNPALPFKIIVGGIPYVNGVAANLVFGQTYPITIAGGYTGFVGGLHVSQEFSRWGTSVGTLGSTTQMSTTYTIKGPGTLEALVLVNNLGWSGYVEATNAATTDIATGEFYVPHVTFNQSANLTPPEVMALWVGLGGINGNLWQAGIQIEYNNSSQRLPSIQPLYEYPYPSGPNNGYPVYGPKLYNVSQADTIFVNVSVAGAPGCNTLELCWSITDLNQSPYPGQPVGTGGGHEDWFGWVSSSGLSVDLTTADWILEAPGCSSGLRCPMPTFKDATFNLLAVNGVPLVMLGPFLAMETPVLTVHPGNGIQFLTPTLIASPISKGFSVYEG